MSKYILYNGELKLIDDAVIKIDNRLYNYGDGVFETIRCLSSKPLFFETHYQRLKDSLAILKINLPDEYTENYFNYQIERLLQKNRIYKGARVKLTVFRNAGGLYTPLDKTASYTITASPLENELFSLPLNGVQVGTYSEKLKPVNKFSALKTCSALFYVMAGIWKQENDFGDCFILNENGKIIEALSSNIFIAKADKLFTTTSYCGCVDGTMRRNIIELAPNLKIPIKELDGFTESELLEADEILLTNAIQGVSYVAAFKGRRYYNLMAKKLTVQLNKIIQR
jgi:branched-subunit amino acid aminotransferase/4-amino-4-deoxychorismate lyase